MNTYWSYLTYEYSCSGHSCPRTYYNNYLSGFSTLRWPSLYPDVSALGGLSLYRCRGGGGQLRVVFLPGRRPRPLPRQATCNIYIYSICIRFPVFPFRYLTCFIFALFCLSGWKERRFTSVARGSATIKLSTYGVFLQRFWHWTRCLSDTLQ